VVEKIGSFDVSGGYFAKFLGKLIFWLIFELKNPRTRSTGHGPGSMARSTVDRWWRGCEATGCGGALAGVCHPTASGHGSSPVVVEKGEASTGSSLRASLELGRQQGSRVMVVALSGGGARARRGGEESREGCGEVRQGSHPYIGAGEGREEAGRR
jgi:hypothetical protein